MDFNGFLKKIAFIRKINRHIIGILGIFYACLICQLFFFVVFLRFCVLQGVVGCDRMKELLQSDRLGSCSV